MRFFSLSLAFAVVVLSGYGAAESNPQDPEKCRRSGVGCSSVEQQAISACVQKNYNCGCVSSMECHINCSPDAVAAACRDSVVSPRQRRHPRRYD